MPIIRNFIRHTSPERLREYFDRKHIAVDGVDWSQDRTAVARNVIRLVDHLSPEQKARLQIDAERICHMADELGQAALARMVFDHIAFAEMENGVERSQWVYVNEPEAFRHAEDIRYADQYRHGRNWNGYQFEAGIPMATDERALAAFTDTIRLALGLGDKVKLERFERTLPDEDGNDVPVVQLMVYQEGLPDAYLEFEGEDVVSRIRRPVSEHALIYSPETGVLEVVASRRERRDIIAKAFTTSMLQREVEADALPLRSYNLSRLLEDRPLEFDPEDGIESVQIVMMKFKDAEEHGRIMLEVPARSPASFYNYATENLQGEDPLGSRLYVPTQAQIAIRFQREPGANGQRVLPLKITMPNGCDLRNRTDRERLIGEKYLRLWQLLREVR